MLAGVGGRTVAEAKQRISYPEFLDWVSFRQAHGPISQQLRQERLVAAQMLQFSKAHGGKGTFDDFMLWTTPPVTEISLEEAMSKWV